MVKRATYNRLIAVRFCLRRPYAHIAHLVECHLDKVEVASSSLVSVIKQIRNETKKKGLIKMYDNKDRVVNELVSLANEIETTIGNNRYTNLYRKAAEIIEKEKNKQLELLSALILGCALGIERDCFVNKDEIANKLFEILDIVENYDEVKNAFTNERNY